MWAVHFEELLMRPLLQTGMVTLNLIAWVIVSVRLRTICRIVRNDRVSGVIG